MHRLLVALAAAFTIVFTAAAPALAAPSPVEAYGNLPALSDVALSPSGGRMAMIVDDGKANGVLSHFPTLQGIFIVMLVPLPSRETNSSVPPSDSTRWRKPTSPSASSLL